LFVQIREGAAVLSAEVAGAQKKKLQKKVEHCGGVVVYYITR
jgi:hypothetical protein